MDALIEKEGSPIVQFEIGSYKNFVYLILDWTQKKAAIVDPQNDLTLPLSCLNRNGFELTHVLLTHTHFDHIAGVPQLVKSHPHSPIVVHRNELHRLDHNIMNYGKIKAVKEGDVLSVGELEIKVLHTPGHSSGECSYLLSTNPPYLFTGDTVFIQDCGRTDLPTGSNEDMFHSLQRLKRLDPNAIVLPGHHYREEYSSTLAQELKLSPPFQCKSIEELAALP
jgi:glyoxylase-like metal-dependent hydrolase (beta-lactamase superfamily II)